MKAGTFSTRANVATRTVVNTGGAAEVVITEDVFTDANATAITSHTGATGASWTKHPDSTYTGGSAFIQTNRVHNATATVAYYSSGVPATADYNVRAVVHCITALGSHSTGIVGRMHTTNNDFYSVRHNNGATFTLIEVVGGSIQRTVTHTQSLTSGNSAQIELVMSGTSIRMFVDGVDRGGWSDGVITATGRAGIRFNGAQSSTTGYHLDDFKAYHPATGTSDRPAVASRAAVASRTALSFGQLPELPRSVPNPAMPDTTGYSQYTVPGTHATIQLAIDASIDDIDGSGNFKGAEIILAAGGTTTITTTLVGKKLTVPNPNGKYIIIRTSNLAGLPAPDTPWHTTPITGFLSAMHKIQTASTMPKTGSSSVLFKTQTDTDAGWYRFVGIELTVQTASTALSRLLELGSDAVTSVASQAHHIGIDRCYLHGHDNCSVQRGIVMNCYASFCVDSTLAEFWSLGTDAQAINGVNGGPGDDPAGREGVLIRNNRLEGSGENIMLGGGGTLHMDLLPADWTIERNYFVKPIAWRSSVIPAPTITSQSLVAGGTLTQGTSYMWALAARGFWADSSSSVTGENVKTSIHVPTATNKSVTLAWNEVLISTTNPHRPVEYRIYESQDGGATWVKYYTVADTGAASYSITIDGSNASTAATSIALTRRVVKNLFELKIGSRMDIIGNLFETTWEQGQAYAVKVTISNPYTVRPDLSVSHWTFRYNVFRHCPQFLNILGTDSFTSRTPVHTGLFYHNLIEDINATTWGGLGYAIYTHGSSVTDRLKQQPHNIQVVHNTFINPTASFLRIDDDEPPFVVPGHNWIFHSNIAHYGGFGVTNTSNFIDAEDALNTNFINLLFARNVLGSGGSGSAFGVYAANNAFPTASNLTGVGFVSYDGATGYPYPPGQNVCLYNFRLAPSSSFKGYALDGSDPGADLDLIEQFSGLDLTP